MTTSEQTLFDPADVTRETKTKDIFESYTCGRCCGNGYFSCWGHVNGGRCFGCGGSGRKLTKRGQAARAFFLAQRDTPVEDIRPGDKLFYQGFSAGSFTQGSFWHTVTEVTRDGDKVSIDSVQKNGEKFGLHTSVGSRELVALDPAIALALRKTVAEYQANLTKAGTPRKGTRWAAC